MEFAIITIFVLGYLLIAFEHLIEINKAAIALVSAVLCWTIYIVFQSDKSMVHHQLELHLAEVSGILFFLLGAMTIVELIDAHDGFQIITEKIKTKNAVKLLWIVSFLAFFLSSLLDNLTTTIVLVSLLRKLIADKEQRLYFLGIIIIAANAGGAWSPIGDVTTTMLWIGGQINVIPIITKLFLPSLFCLIIPLIIISRKLKGNVIPPNKTNEQLTTTPFERNFVFYLGLFALIFVPIFKTITHLPPFMAILLGLGVMWIITELIHKGKDTEDKDFLTVVYALRKIDTPSILFFLGILTSIGALQAIGSLENLAIFLENTFHSETIIVTLIGLLSAIVDNVPLVAAAQGMYPLSQYPTDHFFWEFLAYTSGTGGSILIIGSAAGVAAMGMEKIDFFWYLKKITFLALIGFFSGVAVYLIQYNLLHIS